MASAPTVPNGSTTQATHTVSVTLRVDGKDVSQNPGGLISLSIYKEFNKIPTAKIIIADGAVERGSFAKSGSQRFVPGKETDIQIGYQNETESIFKGIIVRHSIKASSSRPSVLELECKDPSVKMALVRRSRYFSTMTDKDVFREILDGYSGKGISIGELADTEFEHPELVQYHCTDWDFLVMRAEANGLVVVADAGEISIVKLEVGALPNHTATWGEDIIDFEAEMDARTHFPEVEASTWDNSNQELAQEEGSGNSGGLGGALGGLASAASAIGSAVAAVGDALGIDLNLGIEDDKHNFPEALYGSTKQQLFHGGDMATQELSAWAKGHKKRGELSQVRGRVCVRGKDFKPNETLGLQRVASRFNGNHLITGVMHQVHDGTWQADIQFGISTKILAQTAPDIAMPEASGLVAAIKGMHVGVVTKIGGDTQQGNHRIKVKIPYIANQGGSNEGVWARLATLYAGNNIGFAFRPEIGDEVILGFINDDPNDAVILGSLHSSANAAPIPATDTNLKKVFFAKEGMQLIFDDQKKSIELKTEQGYSILMSEQDRKLEIKDSNNNSIKLSSSGILLDSQSNLTIRAVGNVKINGAQVRINDPA